VLHGLRHEVLVFRDARSLAEAYNRGIARSAGEIVVFSHDDVDVLADDFAARLLRHLALVDVVGVVGATRMSGPLPIWAGHPHLRGWITHRPRGGAEWHVDLLDHRPLAREVVVLDGVLLAARRSVLSRVAFDAVAFDGFHGYDVDWSWRAAQAGFRLAAAGDLRVVHESRGRFDATWQRYADRLCAKHGLAPSSPPPPPYYQAVLQRPEEVNAFLDRLTALAADLAMYDPNQGVDRVRPSALG
jgi:hypothetical protein